eukprot:GHRQ01003787.1.p1 GENE.GHRQ01003787.1~~GHRQ01003787.1.p1  ORF type:complete len:414 (+),score=150.91 GHRQ01003787.1:159-1400(+)
MASNKVPGKDLIQDITTRFILTAPAEQLMAFESIMFLVEQAHWYYEDFVREQDSTLRSLSLKDFAVVVFQNCPELRTYLDDIEQIMEHFKAFKKNVPVMGGILLDKTMQRVLLVKGWKNTACWGFPRGKIHKNETDAQCAVREVLEETGYDIEELVCEDDFIELNLDGKRNKLYIVAGLDPDNAQFAPKCKGEIGGYAWHKVTDLPATRDESNQTFLSEDGVKHKFFMVWPYLKPLRRWIKKRQSNHPTWDMPVNTSTAEQAQQPQQQQVHTQQQGSDGAAINVHMPYYPQQVQQLLGSEQQQAASSPQHTQPQQQLGRQQRTWTPGSSALQQLLQSANKGASSRTGGITTAGSVCGPLAPLFGAAAAATGCAAALDVVAATDSAVSCPRQFRFDSGSIMHALQPAAATAAQR